MRKKIYLVFVLIYNTKDKNGKIYFKLVQYVLFSIIGFVINFIIINIDWLIRLNLKNMSNIENNYKF